MSKTSPISVALFGAGRIGQEHARNLAALPDIQVQVVCDPIVEAAQRVQPLARALEHSADFADVMKRSDIDAVVICTPTDTHADLIEAAARTGKAIFCEKPVALDLNRTNQALKEVERAQVPFQIGFQRRFDTGYAEAKRRIEKNELGRLDQFRAVGRDPAPPAVSYLEKSGGLFIDQAIHDFDLARFLMGEVESVSAWGTVRFLREAAQFGDVDTATTMLRFASGALGVVENSRQAVYGYDIVTEVFGEHGKLLVQAEPKTPLRHYHREGYRLDHFYFFMDRFGGAFRTEIAAFFAAVREGRTPSPGAHDALASLQVSIAATISFRENRPVKLAELGEG